MPYNSIDTKNDINSFFNIKNHNDSLDDTEIDYTSNESLEVLFFLMKVCITIAIFFWAIGLTSAAYFMLFVNFIPAISSFILGLMGLLIAIDCKIEGKSENFDSACLFAIALLTLTINLAIFPAITLISDTAKSIISSISSLVDYGTEQYRNIGSISV